MKLSLTDAKPWWEPVRYRTGSLVPDGDGNQGAKQARISVRS